jgi:hypothetical protein
MTKFSSKCKPVRTAAAVGLIAVLAVGCANAPEPPQNRPPPRPGVLPEIWVCLPDNTGWDCEQRAEPLR